MNEVGEVTSVRSRPVQRPMAAHLASLALGFLLLVIENRDQWFFGDDWDFLVHRSLRHDLLGSLFRPHNEHWQTVPVVVYRGMFALFGLDHPLLFVIPVLVAHLVVVHMVWRFAQRLGASPWMATVAVLPVLVLGSGAENLLWDFQVGFVGSVAFGLLAVWFADAEVRTRRSLGISWAFAVLALMCSGLGVTMTVLAGLAALFRRGARDAVRVILLPTLVFAAWYSFYGHKGAAAETKGLNAHNANLVPTFVMSGLQTAAGGLVEWAPLAPLVLLFIGVMLARGLPSDPRWRLSAAFGLSAIAFYLITAVGRIGFGVVGARPGRYTYTAAVLLAPVLIWSLSQLPGPLPGARWVGPITVLLVVTLGGGALVAEARRQAAVEQALRHRILAGMLLIRDGETLVTTQVEPISDPDLLLSSIQSLGRAGKLPDLSTVTSADLAKARARLEVKVGPQVIPSGVPTAAVTAVGADVTRLPEDGGCAVLTATGPGTVDLTPGVSIVTSNGAAHLPVLLVSGSRLDPAGSVTWNPGRAVDVRLSSPGGQRLRLGIPLGTTRLCAR